jgi:hypothetical protein
MPIKLQGTGVGFERHFIADLPRLEREMLERGLDPDEFVIAKAPAVTANVPLLGPFFYDYTVFIGDEHFTVTEPNDERFFAYLSDRILAPDEPEVSPEQKALGLLGRFARWMAQPI